jgi:hypothetical protein
VTADLVLECDRFNELFIQFTGFPMVRDVVESGAVEELVLLSEKLASQQVRDIHDCQW